MLYKQVSLTYEDGRPVDGKGVGRKVIDRVHETYDTEFGKDFAYDGEKSLFTVGPLPRNKLEFTVVLEDVLSNRFIYILLTYPGSCCCLLLCLTWPVPCVILLSI